MTDRKVDIEQAQDAKDRFEKWKLDNKQPTCSNGYLFNCLGHDIHVTELLPFSLFIIALAMFLVLVSGVANIESVVFAGMSLASSGIALVVFWNYADIIKPRQQADFLEALVEKFSGSFEEQKENNDKLKAEVDKLKKDTVAIQEQSNELGKQLGILNEAGNEIEGVLEGYEEYLTSKQQLDDFRQKELEVREKLLRLEAEFLVSNVVNRIKRGMKDLFSNYVDMDEETGELKKYISFRRNAEGKYENRDAEEFVAKIGEELKGSPEILEELTSKLDKMDADKDGKLTTWEFMLEVDKAVGVQIVF